MLNQLKQNLIKEIEQVKDLKKLEELYRQYFGRKGKLTEILRSLKDLPEKERKQKGKIANQIKKEIENILEQKKYQIRDTKYEIRNDWIDVTAPGTLPLEGYLHPISLVQRQVEEIFQSMGFSVVYGPEIESEYYNFDALNVPQNHPARDLWDTFWLKSVVASEVRQSREKQDSATGLPRGFAPRNDVGKLLLRTHTSPMQSRYMEKNNPPLRIIVPGRCFRHEATDASHDVQFNQVEGLMVGEDVSMTDFKGIIEGFLKRFLDPAAKMRLRPSYFPFTEPSFEVDVKSPNKDWLEIMGAGMVHPNVFKAVGYLPNKWQGFAFGVGLDRLAMIRYKIDDIRLFYSGDLRFLKQF